MYIPPHFKENNNNELLRFIKGNSFGIIVSADGEVPKVTHLPFVLQIEGDRIILLSHFAKANPHWQHLIAGNEVIVVFQGPNAYISPSHYEHKTNVPTWNFAAVHAHGTPEIISGSDDVVKLMLDSFEQYEPEFKSQWEELPDRYKQTLLSEIVPFRIIVTSLEGKYKLSQNKSISERMNIINSFYNGTDPVKHNLAEMMKKSLDNDK